jgi:hypothetical protein
MSKFECPGKKVVKLFLHHNFAKSNSIYYFSITTSYSIANDSPDFETPKGIACKGIMVQSLEVGEVLLFTPPLYCNIGILVNPTSINPLHFQSLPIWT